MRVREILGYSYLLILIIGWVLKSCGYSKHVAGTQKCGYLNSGNSKLVVTYKMRVHKKWIPKTFECSKMWILNNCAFSHSVVF